MKVSYNWLSRYLSDIPPPREAADILTLAGLEVEETEQTGSDFEGIVVGEVQEVHPHPDADRLVVCKVDIGSVQPSQIVCGAPNVATGQKVAVATVGSVLPMPLPDGSPFKIRKAKIRGQQSSGMICAEDELGLGDNHTGILVLDPALKPGTPFAEVAGTNRDYVFEVGLTPNRPDATCHLGVARDLSAVTGAQLRKPFDRLPKIASGLGKEVIRITDSDKCHRYVGIVMRGISVAESPQWLKELLTAIGLRPVNNVVDITNFVLHELGQPLHAFDLYRIADQKIDVRSFEKDTNFTTLDDMERNVPAGSLFICDGEKPVALAGIMGGVNSEISENTTDILIESAWFEPVGIRKTSRRLSLQTDSSYRFERGVDPSITKNAALRCAELILELCGGIIEGMEDVHPVKTNPVTVALRHDRLNKILGLEMEPDRVTGILERLEILPELAASHGNASPLQEKKSAMPDIRKDKSSSSLVWHCTVPTFRPDITTEIDLIEEVARIYDYNNIPDPDRITIANPEPVPFSEYFREKVRQSAVSSGLKEIYTNSLLPERYLDDLGGYTVVISTLNPITKDQSLLRTQLLYGFLRSAAYNFNRGATGVRFFEIGNIFRRESNGGTWIEGIHEATHLHIGIAGNTHADHWKVPARPYDLFDLKGMTEALLFQIGLQEYTGWKWTGDDLQLVVAEREGARDDMMKEKEKGKSIPMQQQLKTGNGAIAPGTIIGTLSRVDQNWKKHADIQVDAYSAEVDIGPLEQLAARKAGKVYRPVSRFPSFEFDLALVIDKHVDAGKLVDAMYRVAGNQLVSVDVFDVFEGGNLQKHQKSIAFRLTFQDNARTLTINDVEPVIQMILKQLGSDFSAQLRF